MNTMENIKKIINRKSERNYLEKEIEKEKIELIFQAINSSPTSSNSHDFSVFVIDDKELRKAISLNIETQKHIYQAPLFLLFCADLNRVEYAIQPNENTSSLNSFLTASGDAFIAASQAQTTAVQLGLGTCYVGIIRASLRLLEKALNLPNKIIPIIGLTIGYCNSTTEQKPKLNHIYKNKYDILKMKNEVETYNQKMQEYYQFRNSNQKHFTNWKDEVKKSFSYSHQELDDYIKSKWNIK